MVKVAVVSGQSGIGKDSVIRELTSYYNFLGYPSMTTRPPRKGEIDEVHYYFVSEHKFKDERRKGNLLDCVCISGYYYGFPIKKFLQERRGLFVLNLVPESGLAFGRILPAKTFYLLFPSKEEQVRRMRSRGMSDYEIGIRLRDDPNPKTKPVYYEKGIVNADSKKTAFQIANQFGVKRF